MHVYIAGPYTKGDVAQNVRAAIDAAEALQNAGHTPYCPHLSHFQHLIHPHPVEHWYKLDLAWLARCDALLRLPGESAGADNEVAYAQALGIPIYQDIRALPESPPSQAQMRWLDVTEMPDQPMGWYWAAFPGAWVFYRADCGVISSAHGDLAWHAPHSQRYFGPWKAPVTTDYGVPSAIDQRAAEVLDDEK